MSDSKKSDNDDDLPANPTLSKLVAKGVDVSDVIGLAGYVGTSAEEGTVRLYPGLEKLSVSVDIAKGDIVHVERASELMLPNDGVIVWVGKSTEVIFRRTRTVHMSAEAAGPYFCSAAEHAGTFGAERNELRAGRLNIQMRGRSDLRESCRSYCWTCQSHCTRCTSRPGE